MSFTQSQQIYKTLRSIETKYTNLSINHLSPVLFASYTTLFLGALQRLDQNIDSFTLVCKDFEKYADVDADVAYTDDEQDEVINDDYHPTAEWLALSEKEKISLLDKELDDYFQRPRFARNVAKIVTEILTKDDE